jgi:hypothetical protein
MTPQPSNQEDVPGPTRWQVAWDVIVFQFKLLLDGLRDLLLSPISLFAALYGIATDAKNPGRYFYRLMALGRDSDRWINLFNAHNDQSDDQPSADQVVRRAEDVIREHYARGGLVRDFKERTDSALDRLQARGTSNNTTTDAPDPDSKETHP